MNDILIDTSVVFNHINGDYNILQHQKKLHISILTYAEISDVLTRKERSNHLSLVKQFILQYFYILPLNLGICELAAILKSEIRRKNPKFGLVDALLLATAQKHKLQFYTFDHDFIGIDGCLILNS